MVGIEKAKLKKFLSLKYSYKNAALLLLWIACDIHKNPGPIEEPFSKRIRPVLEKICSKILKIYNGFSSNTNPKNIWTKQANFYLYDCQTDYTYMCDYKSLKTESLIDILLVCCEKKGCNTDELANEIKAWKTNDFNQLFRLHYISTCVSEKVNCITSTLERVKLYADLDLDLLQQLGIELNDTDFQIWMSVNPTEGTRKKAELCWEACRYITSVLCKLVTKEGTEKTYNPPEDWPADFADFKDPHNQKKNQQLKRFFNDLLKYCYDKKPDNKFLHDLKSYIGKCQEWIRCPQMQDDLLNEYVLRHDVAVIMEKLQSLQCESLLCVASTMLSERGIKLLTDKWTTEVSSRDPQPYSRKRKHYEYQTAEGPKIKSAKATGPKISLKERQLRTETEIWIKLSLNGEPIKVTIHGNKPDFSNLTEIQCQDVQKKDEMNICGETHDEFQHSNPRNTPLLQSYDALEMTEKVTSTTTDQLFNQVDKRTSEMITATTDDYTHQTVTVIDEALTNIMSNYNDLNNNCNYENIFDNISWNNDDLQSLLSILNNNTDMNNDVMEDGQSCNGVYDLRSIY